MAFSTGSLRAPPPCRATWPPPAGAGVGRHAQTGRSQGRAQGAPRHGEPPPLHRNARRVARQRETHAMNAED